MRKPKVNIESYLKQKQQEFPTESVMDWSDFDQKLSKALLFQKLRKAAFVSTLVLLYIALSYGNLPWNSNVEYTKAPISSEQARKIAFVQPQEIKSNSEILKKVDSSARTLTNANQAATTDSKQEKSKLSLSSPSIETSRKNFKSSAVKEKEANAEAVMTEYIRKQRAVQYVSLNPKAMNLNLEEKAVRNGEALFGEEDIYEDLGLKRSGVKFNRNAGPKKAYISPLQEKRLWSYSINVYPNFTFRKFTINDERQNLVHRDYADAVNESESGQISMNVGFEVSRRIGPITYLNTGIESISYTTNATYNFMNFRDANFSEMSDEILNYSIKETPERVMFADKNVYNYINIPLSISYQPWASQHVRLNLEVGTSLLCFMGASGKTIDYRTLEVIDLSSRSYNKYMGSFSFKVGVNYYLSEKLNLGFEPTMMYFTNTIYDESYPFEVVPYSVGLNVNLQLKLN